MKVEEGCSELGVTALLMNISKDVVPAVVVTPEMVRVWPEGVVESELPNTLVTDVKILTPPWVKEISAGKVICNLALAG